MHIVVPGSSSIVVYSIRTVNGSDKCIDLSHFDLYSSDTVLMYTAFAPLDF